MEQSVTKKDNDKTSTTQFPDKQTQSNPIQSHQQK